MSKGMTEEIVKDDAGREIKLFSKDGYKVPTFFKSTEDVKAIHAALPDITLREDDVMLFTYPKTGTNWLFEVLTMIQNKSAERVQTTKMFTMIEAQTQEDMDKLPSPRVMNTHLNYRFLPKDLWTKQTKGVLIVRNPKDTAVSLFNHMKGIKLYDYNDGEWKDWFRPYVNGQFEYGKYTDYLKDWEQAITTGVGFPLHVMYFEDMKLNAKEEIDKLCKFLKVELDDKLKQDIVEASTFDKMAVEKPRIVPEEIAKLVYQKGFKFYRKGQIGDWMNWFTVAQNEDFDKIWEAEMKNKTRFTFKYSMS